MHTPPPFLTLADGNRIPQVGFGVWQVPEAEAAVLVRQAFAAGYRSIDTAMIYENEGGVGEAIRTCGLAREELFITTKLWNDDQGFDQTLRAFEASLKRLQLTHLDLYLIHWPSPRRGLFVDSWRALIRLQQEGRVRSIGVSNFQPAHLERIIGETGVTPVVNQIELHPRFQQKLLRATHDRLGIRTEAWSPLGQGQVIGDPTIVKIAAHHGRSTAQVILRWHIENGLIAIPKSATPARLVENLDVFTFQLTTEDRAAIDRLDQPRHGRIGPNPDTATF